jgi:hypothetical protein
MGTARITGSSIVIAHALRGQRHWFSGEGEADGRHRHFSVRHRRAANRPVFVDGKKVATLRGPTLTADFKAMMIDYIERRFGQAGRAAAE